MDKSLDDIIDAHSGRWIDCSDCHGIGAVQIDIGGGGWTDPEPCSRCDSTGRIFQKDKV